jgi:hypothetical protein
MLPPSQIIVYLIYSIQIDIFLLVYLLFVFFGNNIASLSPYDDICLCLSDLFRRIFLPPVARDLGGRGAGDRNGGERNGGERGTRSASLGIPMPESAIPGPYQLEFQCQRARYRSPHCPEPQCQRARYQVRINWNSNARERDTRSVSTGIPMPESAIPESALPGTAMPESAIPGPYHLEFQCQRARYRSPHCPEPQCRESGCLIPQCREP